MKLSKLSGVALALAISGTLLLLVGIIVLVTGDYSEISYSSQCPYVAAWSALTPENYGTKFWLQAPYNVTFKAWIFNVTNSPDVKAGQIPILSQQGPYAFKLKLERSANFDDGTVKYSTNKTYIFDETNSCANCSESDRVVVPNIPYLAIFNLARSYIKEEAFNDALNLYLDATGDKSFADITVGELLFQGYRDNILGLVECVANAGNNPLDRIKCIANVPSEPDAYMGLLYGVGRRSVKVWVASCAILHVQRNGSTDGEYIVNNGATDVTLVGKIQKWQGKSMLDYWDPWGRSNPSGILANYINGSDASVFAPALQDTDILQVWDDTAPENIGFCLPQSDGYYKNGSWGPAQHLGCLPPGLLNATTCQIGGGYAPFIISLPHFLDAPAFVPSSVIGLTPPDPDLHAITFDIEPTSGILVSYAKRFQISTALWSVPGNEALDHVLPTIIPMAWFSEDGVMTDEAASDLKTLTTCAITSVSHSAIHSASKIAGAILIVIGLVIIIGLLLAALMYRHGKTLKYKLRSNAKERSVYTNSAPAPIESVQTLETDSGETQSKVVTATVTVKDEPYDPYRVIDA